MSKVLIINGSVSPIASSFSAELSKKFLEEYTVLNPNDEIIHLDLNETEMAKIVLTRDNFSNFFNEKDALNYIKQLKEVDKVIMVAPMYNFNVSSLIKNYLDHILVANETFSYKYSKKGDAIGLLTNLKVQILTTQGAPYGWYMWGNHTEYLRGTWEFAGATVVEPILLAGTKTAPFNQMTPVDVVATISDQIKKAAKAF
ncbi:FMN-dependent NADH-azoreductase [Mesoplasma photuris]|uniref:FMN-dependent NADH-azoreductase n=1 Tax=Mesoplasma photuris TaxID=217731 RepID=UPI0004E235CB|nr:FMN-dependent NADH-azoreductase [Mesoplasma photuris]